MFYFNRAELTRWFWNLKVAGLLLFIVYIAVPIFLMDNSWIIPKLVFSTVGKANITLALKQKTH